MIRLALFICKITLFSVVVLAIGQIPVGNERICDHVRDIMTHSMVLKPVRWVSGTFNFLEGHKAVHASAQASHVNGPEQSEHSESDRSRLSGLLKKNGR